MRKWDHPSTNSSVQESAQLRPSISYFAAVSVAALLAFAVTAVADDSTPQAKRTIIDRHDQSDVSGKAIILGTAQLPAGATIGWHTHDGDEIGYVLQGNLILKTRGKPDQALKAGDHFFNARGTVHSVIGPPGSAGGTAVSTWIVDKGKPLASPAN
jgi:quercetin dioxygenase-like cupin family protein